MHDVPSGSILHCSDDTPFSARVHAPLCCSIGRCNICKENAQTSVVKQKYPAGLQLAKLGNSRLEAHPFPVVLPLILRLPCLTKPIDTPVGLCYETYVTTFED